MDVERWIAAALAGDEGSWVRLLGALWEQVDAHVGTSRSMGQLRGSIDDRREVVSRVFARLRRNEYRALRTLAAWRDRNPAKTFDDWLRILVANVIRDYVGERIGADGLRRFVTTLAEAFEEDAGSGRRPAITDALLVDALLNTAADVLPPDQHDALHRWLVGESFAEIATATCIEPVIARNKVRAALARLRRDVRNEDG